MREAHIMFEWISANIGTIIAIVIVALIVAAAVFVLVRDKKRGKSIFGSSCGGGCANCPMHGSCHKK